MRKAAKRAPATTPAVRIRALREGFRRAGIAHSTDAREYPAGTFSTEQLAELEACPMIEVTRAAPPRHSGGA